VLRRQVTRPRVNWAASRLLLELLRRLAMVWSSSPTAPRIPSDFPPPDARPRGTGRNKRGRRVTAEAVSRPFVQLTGDHQDQVATGGDPRGDGGACKTAGFAYTGSNPVPATTFDLRKYTAVTRLRQGPFYQRSISFYRSSEPALLLGRTGLR
jgi:hypothetical protein